MQINFQGGVDSIYDACVAKGSTPASTSLSDVVAGIMAIPGATIHTATDTASTSSASLDMGENHNYRYVDTSSLSKPVLIGSYTGDKTINVSSYKRSTDTANNFIIEFTSVAASCNGVYELNDRVYGSVTSSGYFSKSLSGSNLTVKARIYLRVYQSYQPAMNMSAYGNISYKVYHI